MQPQNADGDFGRSNSNFIGLNGLQTEPVGPQSAVTGHLTSLLGGLKYPHFPGNGARPLSGNTKTSRVYDT